MSKIKNGGLDQYGPEPLEQQQFGTAGDELVKNPFKQFSQLILVKIVATKCQVLRLNTPKLISAGAPPDSAGGPYTALPQTSSCI